MPRATRRRPAARLDRDQLRSRRWFGPLDLPGIVHRASLKAEGISQAALDGRPIVGICNSWSELVNCNFHFRLLADAVKRGVLQAGGLPLEFPTMSLGENLMKPTTMLYRNLMAMEVEESIRAYPIDCVVLIAGCDKTVPAQLMGAASVDVPAIMVTGGPACAGHYRGRALGSATDLWRYADEYRAGNIPESEFREIEAALIPSTGHCSEMGTASTMAALVEALGMSLPGAAAVPAVDARRYAVAEATGRHAVKMALHGPSPSEILTAAAFDNAIRVLMAVGGSTNAVIHLLALAGRMGVDLTLDRFDELSRDTPVLVNVRPTGEYLFEDFFRAGGVPAVLKQLSSLLHLDVVTVSGEGLEDVIERAFVADPRVIASLDRPLQPHGAIVVLSGSLAPNGAVMKVSTASPHLLRHRGPALVFEDIEDLSSRIDQPDLAVTEESVLVLRNSGPRGGPGMPEWGQLPIPRKLLARGVKDMVRVSDARMSGTAYGTTVLHVAPESAVGGPLAAVRDGDIIALDVPARRIDLEVSPEQVAGRLAAVKSRPPHYRRGYGALYLQHVLQADEGCDFDFLRHLPDEAPQREPLGLVSGWIGGW